MPITKLGTSNTFSKFIDLLTDLGSPMPPSSALFLPIMVLKRSEPIPQTQQFPLCQTCCVSPPQQQEQNPCTVQIQRETPRPTAETPARPLAAPSRCRRPRALPHPPLVKVKSAHQLWAAWRSRKCSRPLVAALTGKHFRRTLRRQQERPPLSPPPGFGTKESREEAR